MDKYIHQLGMACGVSMLLLSSCGSDKTISERVAMNEVTHYVEANPIYETADMPYGEIKFKQKSDAGLLSSYRELEEMGYVTLELLKERKRFLSKDSSFVYRIQLTDKSISYVLEKTDKKVKVKTFDYLLDDSGDIHVEQSGKNKAKATVTLRKKETDFAAFATKEKNSNASFTKKTYSLRFREKSGWEVVK